MRLVVIADDDLLRWPSLFRVARDYATAYLSAAPSAVNPSERGHPKIHF